MKERWHTDVTGHGQHSNLPLANAKKYVEKRYADLCLLLEGHFKPSKLNEQAYAADKVKRYTRGKEEAKRSEIAEDFWLPLMGGHALLEACKTLARKFKYEYKNYKEHKYIENKEIREHLEKRYKITIDAPPEPIQDNTDNQIATEKQAVKLNPRP